MAETATNAVGVRAYGPQELLCMEVEAWPSERSQPPQVLGSSPPTTSLKFEFKLEPFDPDNIKYRIFGQLQANLARCHRRRVMFEEKKLDPHLTHVDFFREVYLRPTLEVFNQTKHPNLKPIQYREKTIVDGTVALFTLWGASKYYLPVLLVLEPGTLDPRQWCSGSIDASPPCNIRHRILSELEPSLSSDPYRIALLSDLHISVILRAAPHPNDDTRLFQCEVVKQPDLDERTIRMIIATCIYAHLPEAYLDQNTQEWTSIQGALNNPDIPPFSDKEVLATKKHLSDFDLYTLIRDSSKADQFFRWKEHVHKDALSRKCIPGDILSAVSNELGKRSIPLRNRHPLRPLPPHTTSYIENFRRPYPTALAKTLELSQTFEVRLTKILKSAEEGSEVTAVYACQLITIDGRPVEDGLSSDLCVKIFDDRVFPFKQPKEEDPPVSPVSPVRVRLVEPEWFETWMNSEDMVRTEEAVYKRLEHAQGSVIPWYYGSHMFVLPDGYPAFGILMEFVQGCNPESGVLKDLSEDAQITFIKSVRHAIRVLQYGDVSQLDWDQGQIICAPAPVASQAPPGSQTCVFVDFTSTSQSDAVYDSRVCDDYGEVVEILCESSGLSKGLLRRHLEEREKWSYYLTDHLKEDGGEIKATDEEDDMACV